MNEVEWRKDGEVGCLMELAFVTILSVLSLAMAVGGYFTLAWIWS